MAAVSKDSGPPLPSTKLNAISSQSVSTLGVHGDDHLNTETDVAPSLHVSTTFRYSSNPDELEAVNKDDADFDFHNVAPVYSRCGTSTSARLEAILSSLLKGHALSYASGLAAFHALLVYFRPNVIAIGGGYHGCHAVVKIHKKLYGLKQVDLWDEATWDAAGLGEGDIVHLETPINPTGEAYDIEKVAEAAHKRGAYLSVDATFGPPGLQDPFIHGADVVMHSGTKYIGGHSDMLCGVLAVKSLKWWNGLFEERLVLGGVMGSFEGWLGVRSLRTLEIRVQRQSQNAEKLVKWIHGCMTSEKSEDENVRKAVSCIKHASLQPQEPWLKKQMPNGFGPVFSIWLKTTDASKRFPSKLKLFHHATSLGGVESLIEWRKMSDPLVDDRLLRVSVGVEGWEDLKDDFASAFRELAEEGSV